MKIKGIGCVSVGAVKSANKEADMSRFRADVKELKQNNKIGLRVKSKKPVTSLNTAFTHRA